MHLAVRHTEYDNLLKNRYILSERKYENERYKQMEGWRETKTTTNFQTVTSDGGYGYIQTYLYFHSDNKYSVYYPQNYRFIVR